MSDDEAAHAVDRDWLRRSVDRASATYDAAAVLQMEVRGLLHGRLDLTALTPQRILDAGAGTGHGARALARRYPAAHVIALDTSLGMLRIAGRRRSWLSPFARQRFARVCGDAARLPLPDASVDLIVSNLMLHWTQPDAVFAEFRRILAPRGLLTFTTLGPDTLRELRSAWQAASPRDAGHRVARFIDMHDLGDALIRAGFAAPVLDVERYTLEYTDVRSLAADLRAVGGRNAATLRPRGLTGKGRFAALQNAYEAFRRDGRLPATYEVVFGQAWKPLAPPPHAAVPQPDTRVPLEELKRELQTRAGRSV